MMKNVIQSREVDRFDRFLFALVRRARRVVDWADEHLHSMEVILRTDFSQRREQSEAQMPLAVPRSFAVEPQMPPDAVQRLCVDLRKDQRAARRKRQRRHTTAADFDSRFTN